jgi:hypothetical protein
VAIALRDAGILREGDAVVNPNCHVLEPVEGPLRVKIRARRQTITHGRHCTCSPCAREDWTNPDLAPCGMHGEDCPALYQPWGPAGTETPLRGQSDVRRDTRVTHGEELDA